MTNSDLICPQCGGYLAPSVDPKVDQSGKECDATVQRERDAQSGTHAALQESVESLESGHRQTTSIYDRAFRLRVRQGIYPELEKLIRDRSEVPL